MTTHEQACKAYGSLTSREGTQPEAPFHDAYADLQRMERMMNDIRLLLIASLVVLGITILALCMVGGV